MRMKKEAPQLAKDHGMIHLVFEDDFDSLDTIDVDNTGEAGYNWYVERPYCHTSLTAGVDYTVKDSVLTLCNVDSRWNYGIGTYHPTTRTGFSFCQGLLEFRIRIPRPRKNDKEAGEKGVPAVWSFPPNKITDETLEWVEPDWMEYWGDSYWTTSIHHLKRAVYKGPYSYKTTNTNKRGPDGLDDCEWHTMQFLWDDGRIEGYLDDVQTMVMTYGDGKVTPPERLYVGECLSDQYSTMAWEPQTLILGGSKCNPMEVDWIRVWQK